MRTQKPILRRVVLVLGVALALVVAAGGGYVVVRMTSAGDSASSLGGASGESGPVPTESAAAPTSTDADEPVVVTAARTVSTWAHVLTVSVDRLPEPSGPPDDSRYGAADCAPPYRAVREVDSVDAGGTSVNVLVQPKSFQEITVTGFRVRVLAHAAAAVAGRYFYSCENSRIIPSMARPSVSTLLDEEGDVGTTVDAVDIGLPSTVSAERAEVWQGSVSVDVIGGRYRWQVEVDYVNRGKESHVVMTEDRDGHSFVTESAQRAGDFEASYVWCVEPEPGFRIEDDCARR